MPLTQFGMTMSDAEFVPSFPNSMLWNKSRKMCESLLTLPSYILVSAQIITLLPALLEMTSSDTRLYQRSHLYSPGWRVALWCLILRAPSFKPVYFLNFALRLGVWKDIQCPSRLLSCAGKNTSLPINAFSPPFSSLFPFLKNCCKQCLRWFPANTPLQAFYI